MRYLLALLFFVGYLLHTGAIAGTKKHAPPLISKEDRVRAFAHTCIARRNLPDARANIFAVFTESPHTHGAPEKLASEICLASYDNLERFATLGDVKHAAAQGSLQQITSRDIAWPKELPLERRVLRTWAAKYLDTLTTRAYTQGISLRITSLTRPVDLQKKLARSGATPVHCNDVLICGTHTTGAALDISFRNLKEAQRIWLAQELTADLKLGRILFILEEHGGHFHIFVPRPQ